MATDSEKLPPAALDQTADDIIADCDGDPRAAVMELLAIIGSLIHENQSLREAASLGLPVVALSYLVSRPRRAG